MSEVITNLCGYCGEPTKFGERAWDETVNSYFHYKCRSTRDDGYKADGEFHGGTFEYATQCYYCGQPTSKGDRHGARNGVPAFWHLGCILTAAGKDPAMCLLEIDA